MHGQEITKNDGHANHGLSTVVAQPRSLLRNILWSTDFSVPSENSLVETFRNVTHLAAHQGVTLRRTAYSLPVERVLRAEEKRGA